MGNYTIFLMFENPRRSRQARNFTENDPNILDLKSSSEQIIFRKLSLGAPGDSTFLHSTFNFDLCDIQVFTFDIQLFISSSQVFGFDLQVQWNEHSLFNAWSSIM